MTNSDDRTDSDHTLRRERTLPARPAADDDADAAPEPGAVVTLTLPGPRPDANDFEPVPDTAAMTDDPPAPPATEPEPGDGGTAQNERPGRWTGAGRTLAKIVAWTAAFPVLCILPFLVVLRISVLAYQENTHDGWQALVIGILAALLLVGVCIAAFMWTFGIRRGFYMPLLNICLTAMLCYSGFALFHLAVSNAKTAEIRSYYTSLHPFLRVAVKNLTVLDEDLVITDVERTRSAYRAMGLPPRDYSLHFKQPTGFVHAVDIRTVGRSQITNLLVELYFVLMGFETIRHVGTADHLHVALPLVETE